MKFLLCFLAIEISLASFPSLAATAEQDAIGYLISFVETSSCTFVRNGSEYGSREAVDHIKNKYAYFKRRIQTAEDFIDLAATKSGFSGKPYWVRCGKAEQIPTADWLRAELRNFRSMENKN